jgi:glycosyltransferase involved in cell wall biosynthesis
LKLCYLSSSRIPSRSANSVHVMKICEAFAAQGHSVTLFAKKSSSGEEPFSFYGVVPSFALRFMPNLMGWRRTLWLRARLTAQVRALRPDVVYGRNARALLAVSRLRFPIVFEAHLLPTSSGRRSVQEQLFASPRFCRLVVISELLAQDYRREFPDLDPERVVVAHDAASPPPEGAALPIERDRLRVGYVGHLYPGKGMETIEALAHRCPWADFHVVGGMDEDLKRWESRVAELPNLTLHGFVPHGMLDEHMQTFDVVLAPYGQKVSVKSGSFGAERWMSPLKIFEYMSYGKAMVATDLPVIREVLESRKNALLAPAGDLDLWQQALRELADDPALRRELGDRARNDFEARHTWSARARAVLDGLPV